jgi:ketosteroid isomerase-like protein
MKPTSFLLTVASAVALAACMQTPAPPPDTTEADAAAIRAQTDQFLAGFNAGDAAALGGLYAEDAIQMPPDGPANEGREAIVQSLTWNVRQTPKAGGAEQVRNGKWLVLNQRQADGSWKVWRWMWNEEGAASQGGG